MHDLVIQGGHRFPPEELEGSFPWPWRGWVPGFREPVFTERALADGPGKLCQALAVSRADDGADLCARASGLVVRDDGMRVGERSVRRLPRVGVAYAGAAAAWPLRFVLS